MAMHVSLNQVSISNYKSSQLQTRDLPIPYSFTTQWIAAPATVETEQWRVYFGLISIQCFEFAHVRQRHEGATLH